MQKRKYIFIMLGLLMVLFTVICCYLKYQEYALKKHEDELKHQKLVAARHHLLCEVLQPGMSEDEVLNILRQHGEFTSSRAEWSGGLIELGVNFTDPKGKDLYGGFDLGFSDYKYLQAYISGFDYFEDICNFYPAIKLPTGSPRP
jgi:hypothetical protein